MARSIFSEYNVTNSFLAKQSTSLVMQVKGSIVTASYDELLIERKPNISYFLVFGYACYILKKDKIEQI